MAAQTINIQINSSGAKTVVLDLKSIGQASRESGSAVSELKSLLASFGSVLAVDKIRQWSDAWASATGQIRVNSQSTQEAAAVTDLLFTATQRTRQSFPQMVQLYNRMATSVKDLGVSQSQLVGLTENVGKVLAYSHVSAGQASGALLQLSQALGSGIVHAQEFNSVLQGAPAILQVAANHIDAAGGSVTKLRALMLAQQLTSKQLFDAIMAGSQEIDDRFQKSSAMIGQAITIADNAMMKLVGSITDTLGVGNGLVALANLLSNNLDQVSAALIAVGAAAVVAFAPTVITSFASALAGLWALLLANPFVAIAAALAGVVTYLYEMRDAITVTSDGFTTLGDLMRTVWPDIQNEAKEALNTVGTYFEDLKGAYSSAVASMSPETRGFFTDMLSTAESAISSVKALWADYFSGLDGSFEGVAEGIARVFDSVTSIATGSFAFMKTLIMGFPQLINNYLTNAFGAFGINFGSVISVAESLLQHLYNAISRIASAVLGLARTIATTVGNLLSQVGIGNSPDSLLGKSLQAYQDNSTNNHTAENYTKGLFQAAQQNAEFSTNQNRLVDSLTGDVSKSLLTMAGTAVDPMTAKTKKAHQAVDRLQNELRRLLDTIKPSTGATLELAKGQDILDRALKAGKITLAEHDEYVQDLKQHYEDILDPLGKIRRDMTDQTNLLNYNTNARRTYSSVLDYENQLRDKGIILSAQEKQDLTQLIDLYNKRNDVANQYNTIYQDTLGKAYDGSNMQAAARQAVGDGTISPDVGNAYTVQGAVTSAQGMVNSGQGDLSDFMSATVGKAQSSFKGVASGLSDSFSDFFSSFEDGFANSIGKAITGTESFGKALKSVATDAISNLISSLVKLGEQYVITQTMGAVMGSTMFGGGVDDLFGGVGTTAPGWASGGYTGDGGKHDPAGIVHKGEYVFSQEATSRLGVDTLDALHRGDTSSSAPRSTKGPEEKGGSNIYMGDIQINNPNITDGKADSSTMSNLYDQVSDMVQTAIRKNMTDEQRPGGMFWGTGGSST